MRTKVFLLSLSFLAVFACTESTKDPMLVEAAAVHNKAMEIEQSVIAKLDSLEQKRQQLTEKYGPASDTTRMFVASVNELQSSLKTWSSNLIEVPGFEHHHHHHGHDHDHDHEHSHGAKTPEVTPEHMLNIQREFRDSIMALSIRAEELLNRPL
jgi:ABC-type nickel/cobalt efflux system permease component RcnA